VVHELDPERPEISSRIRCSRVWGTGFPEALARMTLTKALSRVALL
jgi:hypothetical protein